MAPEHQGVYARKSRHTETLIEPLEPDPACTGVGMVNPGLLAYDRVFCLFYLQEIQNMKLNITAIAVLSALPFVSLSANAESEPTTNIETIEVKGELLPTPESKAANSLQILTQESLEKSGASHFQDAIQQLGNVNFAAGASRARFIQIRGIGERSQFVDPINPSVGMAIDGIDYSGIGTSASLFDIGQVEVFKGPQGSSVGANAMAGFINMYSSQPEESAPNKFRLEVGNYGLMNVGVAAGTELSKDVQGRFSLNKLSSDGYVENITLDRDDTNNIDELSFRGLLDVEFNSQLSTQFVLHHFDINNGYDGFSLDQNRNTLSDEPGKDKQQTTALAARTLYQGFDNADLTVFLSHNNTDLAYGYDEDWSYVGLHPDEYSSTDNYLRDRVANQADVRLVGKDQSWVAGVYIQSKDVDLTREYTWLSNDFTSNYEQTNFAVYGETRYELEKDINLSAGLRIEKHDGDYNDSNLVSQNTSDTMFGGHLTATKQYDESSMAYVRLSRGFKSGGANGEALSKLNEPGLESYYLLLRENGSFEPEILNNVELGLRYNNLDKGLKASAVLFYSSRHDMQIKQWFTNEKEVRESGAQPEFVGYVSNTPTGSNYGLESNVEYRLNNNVTVYAGLALLSTEIDDMYRLETDPDTWEDVRVNINGREQAHAPGYQYQLGFDWQLMDNVRWNASINGRDDYFYSFSHDEKSQAINLVNTSVTYQAEQFDITLWARNLTNKDYGVRGFYFGNDPRDGYEAKSYEQLGEPRVFGIKLDLFF